MKISILTSVYNEEKILPQFLSHYLKILKTLKKKKLVNEYQICIVDDGSADESWNIIKKNNELNKKIGGIRLDRNYGLHTAAATLIKWVEPSDIVILVEIDNLIPEKNFFELIEIMERNNLDLIWLQSNKRDFIYDFVSKSVFTFLSIISETKIPPNVTGMVVGKKCFENIRKEKIFFINMNLAKCGINYRIHSLNYIEIRKDKPKFTFKKRVSLFLKVFTCSVLPFLCRIGYGKVIDKRECKFD